LGHQLLTTKTVEESIDLINNSGPYWSNTMNIGKIFRGTDSKGCSSGGVLWSGVWAPDSSLCQVWLELGAILQCGCYDGMCCITLCTLHD